MGTTLDALLARLRAAPRRLGDPARTPADPSRPAQLRFPLWAEPRPRGRAESRRDRERASARRATLYGPPPA